MRAKIEDRDALLAVSPAALIAYVIGEGWTRTESFGEHSDVYERPGGPELILPGTRDLGDYHAIINELLTVLAREENRDELQIYRDLVGADRDVIRVRAPYADDDGSIPLEAGVEMVRQAYDMLQAAACAASDPKPLYRAGKVKDAASYMDRVRLGQTEHGSFIVTLLAPVPPALELGTQSSFWPMEDEEPFDRKVTRTLAKALKASKQAAEAVIRGSGTYAFQQAVAEGVNANLCDALAKLIEQSDGLEVSLTWAKTRPAPVTRQVISFTNSDGEILKEAARTFRSVEPRPDEALEAFVIALDRKPEAIEGRVTLRTYLDGSPVSVKAVLPPQLYHMAVTAHEERRALTLTGDLLRSGQRWRLENPRDLGLAPEEALEDD